LAELACRTAISPPSPPMSGRLGTKRKAIRFECPLFALRGHLCCQ
jgi:hypothetical protein